MELLRQRDVQAIMGVISEIYSELNIEALPDRIASSASKVIPASVTGFCKITQNNQANINVEMTSYGNKWWLMDILNRYIHECPFIHLMCPGRVKPHPFNEDIEKAILKQFPDFKKSPKNIALKASDLLTDRQFHSLELFNEFFRPNGIEYVLGTVILYHQNSYTALSFSLTIGQNFAGQIGFLLVS